jgi:hypothetical protein
MQMPAIGLSRAQRMDDTQGGRALKPVRECCIMEAIQYGFQGMPFMVEDHLARRADPLLTPPVDERA